MDIKFLWLDASDLLVAEKKMEGVRRQFAEWDWIRFSEDDYASEGMTKAQILAEAKMQLYRQLNTSSMFTNGKVIYSYRMLPFDDLVEELKNVSGNLLLIFFCKVEKTSTFYKAIKKHDWAKIEEATIPDRKSTPEWIVKRAEYLGTSMEMLAARHLMDKAGIDPNILTMEIRKLKFISDPICAWTVDQAAGGTGETDVFKLKDAILSGDGDMAHTMLHRLLAKGDGEVATLPYLMATWVTDWYMAASLKFNADKTWEKADGTIISAKDILSKLIKTSVLTKERAKKEDDESKQYPVPPRRIDQLTERLKIKVMAGKNSGIREFLEEADEIANELFLKHDQMFPKPGRIYYACKEMQASQRNGLWAENAMQLIWSMMIALRKGETDSGKLMHRTLAALVENA